jgi:hypothetical protein
MLRVIDYDELGQWHPWLTAMVSSIAPAELLEMLKTLRPIEALNYVVENIGRRRLVEHLNSELDRYFVSVYHGTRVTEAELRQIRIDGLRPLRLSERRAPLVAVFSQHPEWSSEKERLLDVQLHRFGPGWAKAGAGCREDGAVNVCLSRAGLLLGCNHYLTHGAEIDQHIAEALFPDGSGLELLRCSRAAKLVKFTAPFAEAAEAANPHGFFSQYELPGLLRVFLSAWAYKTAEPGFSVAQERDGSALKFKGCIPPDRLEIIDVEDAELAEPEATPPITGPSATF